MNLFRFSFFFVSSFYIIWILNFTKTFRKHRKNNSIPPFLSKKVIIISLTHSQENFPLFADFNEQVGRHYRYQRQVSMDAHRPPLHFPKKTDEARENLGRNRAKILRSFFSEIYEHQLVLGIWCSSTKEKMCIYVILLTIWRQTSRKYSSWN